jgi:hypothetical protein
VSLGDDRVENRTMASSCGGDVITGPNTCSSNVARRVERTIDLRADPLSATRLSEAGSVTTSGRDILRFAEREPHVARIVAPGDGVVGRDVAEDWQHDVAGQHAPVDVAELVGHRSGVFALSHRSRVQRSSDTL